MAWYMRHGSGPALGAAPAVHVHGYQEHTQAGLGLMQTTMLLCTLVNPDWLAGNLLVTSGGCPVHLLQHTSITEHSNGQDVGAHLEPLAPGRSHGIARL
jgi:hypothetical protein